MEIVEAGVEAGISWNLEAQIGSICGCGCCLYFANNVWKRLRTPGALYLVKQLFFKFLFEVIIAGRFGIDLLFLLS